MRSDTTPQILPTTRSFMVFVALCLLVSQVQPKRIPVFITEMWRHGVRMPFDNLVINKDVSVSGEETLMPNGMRE